MDNRMSKIEYYLHIATEVASRATCLRRKYGAIIVNNDEIIATGYCGAPRGAKNCTDIGECRRQKLNVPAGQRYELCRSVHAEQNAMLSAARKDMQGATMYVSGVDAITGEVLPENICCLLCKKMLLNSGIETVITRSIRDGKLTHDKLEVWRFGYQIDSEIE
jgi:dCMP deaminase